MAPEQGWEVSYSWYAWAPGEGACVKPSLCPLSAMEAFLSCLWMARGWLPARWTQPYTECDERHSGWGGKLWVNEPGEDSSAGGDSVAGGPASVRKQSRKERPLVEDSGACRLALFYGARLAGEAWWVWLDASPAPSLSQRWLGTTRKTFCLHTVLWTLIMGGNLDSRENCISPEKPTSALMTPVYTQEL